MTIVHVPVTLSNKTNENQAQISYSATFSALEMLLGHKGQKLLLSSKDNLASLRALTPLLGNWAGGPWNWENYDIVLM